MRLQWGRSDEGAEDAGDGDLPSCGLIGFNGAAPMKERKTSRHGAVTSIAQALQWGRADEGAEDAGRAGRDAKLRVASMGPLR